jgi:hypothetical protein
MCPDIVEFTVSDIRYDGERKVLRCSSLPNLKRLIVRNDFTRLRRLDVSDCPNLIELPKELVGIKKLNCRNCPKLKEIPKEYTKLVKLDCYRCPGIKEIPKECIALRKLRCSWCPNISKIHNTFVNLKELDCSMCSITEIPRELVILKELSIVNCLFIREIPVELKNLRRLYCQGCINLKDILLSDKINPTLKQLYCYGCPKLNISPDRFVNLKICSKIYQQLSVPSMYRDLVTYNCLDYPKLIQIKMLPTKYTRHDIFNCLYCYNLLYVPVSLLVGKNKTDITDSIENMYQQFCKQGCANLLNVIFEELIQRTWEPKRAVDWCSFATQSV